jgi:purine-binding chemotaxis protein CheW
MADPNIVEENMMQVATFHLGQEEYIIDISDLYEINRLVNITRVPHTPSHIEGVMNLRGNIVTVLNLHSKFNLEHCGNEEDRRIIICSLKENTVGIIVDKVSEVLHIDKDIIEAPDQTNTAIDERIIKGIAKLQDRVLILLEVDTLLDI